LDYPIEAFSEKEKFWVLLSQQTYDTDSKNGFKRKDKILSLFIASIPGCRNDYHLYFG
jgi:hypothetical protein